MTMTLHPYAREYLVRLNRAARVLPPGLRRELVADIEEHLDEALPPDASDAEVLTVLDRLGEPEEIVALEAPAPDPRGTREWAAIILVAVGGFLGGLGWVAGLIFVWSSPAWTISQKWVGTLLPPAGFVLALLLVLDGAGMLSLLIPVFLLITPLAAGFYLLRHSAR